MILNVTKKADISRFQKIHEQIKGIIIKGEKVEVMEEYKFLVVHLVSRLDLKYNWD